MAAVVHVFPVQRHKQLETLARWIVENHPYDQRWTAITKETRAFYRRQCKRFPTAVAFEQWKDMGEGLAYHVGVIERQVDAA